MSSRNVPNLVSVGLRSYNIYCPSPFKYYNVETDEYSYIYKAHLNNSNFKFPYYNKDTNSIEEIMVDFITEQLTILEYNEYFVFRLGGQDISFGVVKWLKDSRFSGRNLATDMITSVDTTTTIYDFDAFMYTKQYDSIYDATKLSGILVKNKEWFQAFSDDELSKFVTSSDYNNLQAILLQQYYNEYKGSAGFPNLITSEELGIYKTFNESRGFILHSDEYKGHMSELIYRNLKNYNETLFKFDHVGDEDINNVIKYHSELE